VKIREEEERLEAILMAALGKQSSKKPLVFTRSSL